jgi:hypothetical protein
MSNVPVWVGILHPRQNSLAEILIDRVLLAEECTIAAHLLFIRYLIKYGRGFRPADPSRGERGCVAELCTYDNEALDVEMNYLMKSFIFSAKSSIDKGLLLSYLLREKYQKPNPCQSIPDPIKPKGFGKFICGIFEERFDLSNPVLSDYYKQFGDQIIGLRIIRNNIKEFGKAHFERSMGRPCWKYELTEENRNDKTLKYCRMYKACNVPITEITATAHYIYEITLAECRHIEVISTLIDIERSTNGFANLNRIQLIYQRSKEVEDIIIENDLSLSFQSALK